MKKGIELPINILVIVAVAIIVLLGVIALFYSSWFQGTQPVGLESAKSSCCNAAIRQGCSAVLANIGTGVGCSYGDADNLDDMCNTYYGIADDAKCLKDVCGMNC